MLLGKKGQQHKAYISPDDHRLSRNKKLFLLNVEYLWYAFIKYRNRHFHIQEVIVFDLKGDV